jgi:hypothetical protein
MRRLRYNARGSSASLRRPVRRLKHPFSFPAQVKTFLVRLGAGFSDRGAELVTCATCGVRETCTDLEVWAFNPTFCLACDRRHLAMKSEKAQVRGMVARPRLLTQECNLLRGFESSLYMLAKLTFNLLKYKTFFEGLAEREGVTSRSKISAIGWLTSHFEHHCFVGLIFEIG